MIDVGCPMSAFGISLTHNCRSFRYSGNTHFWPIELCGLSRAVVRLNSAPFGPPRTIGNSIVAAVDMRPELS